MRVVVIGGGIAGPAAARLLTPERIESYLAEHTGLALAGAAYRGVGIPDCIESGERAAGSVVRSPATALS